MNNRVRIVVNWGSWELHDVIRDKQAIIEFSSLLYALSSLNKVNCINRGS